MKYSIILANPKGEYLRRYALPEEGPLGDGWHRPHFIAAYVRTSRPVLLTKRGLKISKRIEHENVPERIHLDSTSFQVSQYRPREAMPWQDGTQPRVIDPNYAAELNAIDLQIKMLEDKSRVLRLEAWRKGRPLTLTDISPKTPAIHASNYSPLDQPKEARDETATAS